MTDWQPIETAPTGVPILVWADKLHSGLPSAEVVVIVRVDDYVGYWTNGGPNGGLDFHFESPPTHWMPLPAPPAP